MRASAGSGADGVDPLHLLEARKMQIRSACKKMALSYGSDEPVNLTGRTPVVGKKEIASGRATRRPWATAANGSMAGLLGRWARWGPLC